jgi:hypothetical protein
MSKKYNTKVIKVTQSYKEFQAHIGKIAAFREWEMRMKRGDRLPRGKYFNGRTGGLKLIAIDEAWLALNSK